MVFTLESCSLEEASAVLGQNTKILLELRDRLRDWLKLQPHLPQDISDHFLEHIIIGTKMSLETAKRKLDMFYTIRQYAPEICLDRDPRHLKYAELRKLMQVVYLPKLTPEKYSVSIVKPTANYYGKYNSFDAVRYIYMMGHIHIAECHILGSITVVDNANITLGWVTAHSPSMIKKSEIVATEGYAIRIKGLHFINASRVTSQLVTLAKSVLKPKLAARVHVHPAGSYESLHKLIPKSILPKDYGGDEISMAELTDKWVKKLDEYRDEFLKEDKYLVDERLRPGPAIDSDKLFGMCGSFRKLDVD